MRISYLRHKALIPELGLCSSEDTTRQFSSSLLEESIAKAGTLAVLNAASCGCMDMLFQRHRDFVDEMIQL
jgi:hypothetical protein